MVSIEEKEELECEHCSEKGPEENFELDVFHSRGFWCECCDGFTYYSGSRINKDRFTLLLEDKTKREHREPIGKKLKKQLSPLRYPGGKSKVIDYLYTHLQETKSDVLISPFTGGGSFELAMLDAGVVNRIHLNDLDFGVYSLWWTILHAPYELTERLNVCTPTREDYFEAQGHIRSDFAGCTMLDAAWSTLLVNRLAFSGIPKANPMGGKNGPEEAMLVRWNPFTLVKRINHIYSLREQIEITQLDAIELIQETYWIDEATIFIDPPYVKKGEELYNCFYTQRDHEELAFLLDSLYQGMPGADLLVTYDDDAWLRVLYEKPKIITIGRNYSI